jgi:hypothetical protein
MTKSMAEKKLSTIKVHFVTHTKYQVTILSPLESQYEIEYTDC